MSERTIYDGLDLAGTLQIKVQELETAQEESLSAGVALATAERDYKELLTQKSMELKELGYSVSMIDKIVLGIKAVADLRYQRDVAEVIYDARKERINCTKLEIRVLENQISREYGNKYGGWIMKREHALIPEIIHEALKNVDDAEYAACMKAVLDYAFYGEYTPSTKIAKSVMALAIPMIDRSTKMLETRTGRRCSEYQNWRKAVFERDGYTCQICGQKGYELNAHHILHYSKHPDLRYELSNGITLCEECHKKVHRGEIEL